MAENSVAQKLFVLQIQKNMFYYRINPAETGLLINFSVEMKSGKETEQKSRGRIL